MVTGLKYEGLTVPDTPDRAALFDRVHHRRISLKWPCVAGPLRWRSSLSKPRQLQASLIMCQVSGVLKTRRLLQPSYGPTDIDQPILSKTPTQGCMHHRACIAASSLLPAYAAAAASQPRFV